MKHFTIVKESQKSYKHLSNSLANNKVLHYGTILSGSKNGWKIAWNGTYRANGRINAITDNMILGTWKSDTITNNDSDHRESATTYLECRIHQRHRKMCQLLVHDSL